MWPWRVTLSKISPPPWNKAAAGYLREGYVQYYVIHQPRGLFWTTVPEVLSTVGTGTQDLGHSVSQYEPI